jgi:hypothetical protein
VTPFDNADTAIGGGSSHASFFHCPVNETGVGPLPDVAGEIEYAVFVGAEAANRARCWVEGVITIGLTFLLPKPSLGRLGRTLGISIVAKTAAGSESPFLVGGEAIRCT